jgi:hypothetical protein
MKLKSDQHAADFLAQNVAKGLISAWDVRTITTALVAAERCLDRATYSDLSGQVMDKLFRPPVRTLRVQDEPDAEASLDRALCRDAVTGDGVCPLHDGIQYLGGSQNGR